MITETEAQNLIDLVLDYAEKKCQGTEVTIHSSDIATSRFANNSMTQNQSPDHASLSVRILAKGRQCRLSCDNLSEDALKKLVDDALTACQYLDKDKELLPLPDANMASKLKSAKRYDKLTANLSAQERATAIKEIIQIADKHKLTAAGVVATGSSLSVLGNSKGLYASHTETHAECSVTMKHNSSTGWSKAQFPAFTNLNYQALAQRAANTAINNIDPVDIAPGYYTVILEPSAVLDLLIMLWYDFAATSHIDKLSCFLNKIDKQVLGNNISIKDDVFHPQQAGAPFDGEGLPRTAVNLVEDGIIKNLVYGRRAATKLVTLPTGHGLGEPSPQGEYPVNIVVAGGTNSVDDMIASTEKGILLTRVWYVREVDPTTKIITGMTRDGTFLVENGIITRAVKNLRFNQSIIEMLNNVEMLGLSERTAGEESFPAVVPSMKVRNFHFTSTTTF